MDIIPLGATIPIGAEVEEQIFDYPAEQSIEAGLQLSSSSLSLDTSKVSSGRTHEKSNPILIWLEAYIGDLNRNCYPDDIKQVQNVIDNVYPFNNTDRCIDFLVNQKGKKVFMIMSGSIGQSIISRIHDIPQLDSIFIYCQNVSVHEEWAREWSKVKGVFADISLICNALKQARQQGEKSFTPISFLLKSRRTRRQDFEKLNEPLIYAQILKEILKEIKFDEQSIKDFADYCRQQFKDNPVMLNTITKFELEYNHLPIWWYTSKWFFSSLLNRALRTMQFDIIIKMGFFIHDLDQQIEELHSKQFSGETSPQLLTFYRGQGLSQGVFKKMQQNIGGLMCFNNFLSTSTDRQVSFAYADSNRMNPDLIAILFEITIDSLKSSSTFAYASDNSCYFKEKEVIFSMHTICRILSMEKMHKNHQLWVVKLIVEGNNNPALMGLTNRIRKKTEGATGWHRLGRFLIQIGQFDKAEELYKLLLDQISDESEKSQIYYMLGQIKYNQENYVEAITFYKKDLEIKQKNLSPDHLDLIICYNNIGLANKQMRDYFEALKFYEKTLEIQQKTLPPSYNDSTEFHKDIDSTYSQIDEHPERHKILMEPRFSNYDNLADSYKNIGSVYTQMGRYSKALSSYNEGLSILTEHCSSNYGALADFYKNIGFVCSQMSEYGKARSSHEKALEIQEKTLPPDHANLANPCENIGSVYFEIGEYEKAYSYYEKALKIREKMHHPDHLDLVTSYTNLGDVCSKMGHSTADSYYEKSLKILRKTLRKKSLDLGSSYKNIGLVNFKMGKYSDALENYEKALEIRRKSLPEKHPDLDLATSYNNIGLAYDKLGKYSDALQNYNDALEIRRKFLPENHPDLATSYNNIGLVYDKMGENSKALYYYRKALEIQEKAFSSDHRSFATSYNNMGLLYSEMGQHSIGLSYQKKAIEILEKNLHPYHLDLVTPYNNIGLIYYKMEEYSKAISAFEKARTILHESKLSSSADAAVIYNNLGLVYNKLGHNSTALTFVKKALEITEPLNSRESGNCYNSMGTLHYKMEKHEDAQRYFKIAVSIGEKTFPENHPYLKLYKQNLESIKTNFK